MESMSEMTSIPNIRIYVNVMRWPIGITGECLTKEQEAFCLQLTLDHQVLTDEARATVLSELVRLQQTVRKRALSIQSLSPSTCTWTPFVSTFVQTLAGDGTTLHASLHLGVGGGRWEGGLRWVQSISPNT
jgi:uncharacterized protein YeaC (DUF1315 family)